MRTGSTQALTTRPPVLAAPAEGRAYALSSLDLDLVALMGTPSGTSPPLSVSRRRFSSRHLLRSPASTPAHLGAFDGIHTFRASVPPELCLPGLAIERFRRFARAGTRKTSRLETESPLGAGPCFLGLPADGEALRESGPPSRGAPRAPPLSERTAEPNNLTTQETRTWQTRTERT